MGQSFTCLHYHLIFSTKSREPLIGPELRQRLYDYIGGIIKGEDGRLIAAGGTYDHVHLLAFLHQGSSVANILRDVKANSSKWVHQTFDHLRGFAWQEGYGAFTVSYSNLTRVRAYIANQEEHFSENLGAVVSVRYIRKQSRSHPTIAVFCFCQLIVRAHGGSRLRVS